MNYYNDNDPRCCEWLRELIKAGLIPPGHVDERDIADITGADLEGYTQCHFFAGIAGWPEALRLASWPASRPVWTGSCPCQPWSQAGKQAGHADERDLWHEWFRLIAECRPGVVLGEQVASKSALGWLDGVFDDLEALNYACGAGDLPTACVGSPQIRQRFWWVAESDGVRQRKHPEQHGEAEQDTAHGDTCGPHADGHGNACGPADAEVPERRRTGGTADTGRGAEEAGGSGATGGMAEPASIRRQPLSPEEQSPECGEQSAGIRRRCSAPENSTSEASSGGRRGPRTTADFWSAYDPIPCGDGKARRVEPGIEPLVAGLPRGVVPSGDPSIEEAQATAEARVMRLRGYGNSICPQTAAAFIRAYSEGG